jgi:hypothetical protein
MIYFFQRLNNGWALAIGKVRRRERLGGSPEVLPQGGRMTSLTIRGGLAV